MYLASCGCALSTVQTSRPDARDFVGQVDVDLILGLWPLERLAAA
jgi:hypothetical protein